MAEKAKAVLVAVATIQQSTKPLGPRVASGRAEVERTAQVMCKFMETQVWDVVPKDFWCCC